MKLEVDNVFLLLKSYQMGELGYMKIGNGLILKLLWEIQLLRKLVYKTIERTKLSLLC